MGIAPETPVVGMLITAPTLLLKGGRRVLRVSLEFVTNSPERLDAAWLKSESWQASVTTATSWQALSRIRVRGDTERRSLTLMMLLSSSFPSVAPLPAALGESSECSAFPVSPCLKLTFQPHASVDPKAFQSMAFTEVKLRVSVAGLTLETLANSVGPIDQAKPFLAFGTLPDVGSYLEMSDGELAVKPIVRASMNVTWSNLPQAPNDLESRYAAYGPPRIENRSFQAALSIQCKGAPPTVCPSEPLFTARDEPFAALRVSRRFVFDPTDQPPRPWDQIRMTLTAPEGAFGFMQYPQLLAAALAQSNIAGSNEEATQALPSISTFKLLQPPFAPMVSAISVQYVAVETLTAPSIKDGLLTFGQSR